MKRTLKLLALIGGIALIGAAIFLEDDLPASLVALAPWAGGLLIVIGLLPEKSLNRKDRSSLWLASFLGVTFLVLATRLAKMQVFRQKAFAGKVGTDPVTGEVLSNPRLIAAQLNQPRGEIQDDSGEALVYSEQTRAGNERRYRQPEISAFAGYFSPMLYGNSELESSFDDELRGQEDRSLRQWFEQEALGEESQGNSLELTINSDMQRYATDLLAGRPGAIVLVETRSGAVRALVSTPSPDVSRLAATSQSQIDAARTYWTELNADPLTPLVMRATMGLYPPGSVFKVVTASAAIDSGVATPQTIYEDDGELDIDGRLLIEQNRPDDSVTKWPLADGLAYSLNLVFAQVGLQLGAETLTEYANRFGFDGQLPFDVPVADSQLASNADFLDQETALADTAFGQGELLTTPLHIAMIGATIANQGQMMRPMMVHRIVDEDNDVLKTNQPSIWRDVITPESADQVLSMMQGAVSYGYASAAAIDGIPVAGKTGTAEVEGQEPHGWFLGMAGADRPDFAVSVLLEHGGTGASEPARLGGLMLEQAIRNLQIIF